MNYLEAWWIWLQGWGPGTGQPLHCASLVCFPFIVKLLGFTIFIVFCFIFNYSTVLISTQKFYFDPSPHSTGVGGMRGEAWVSICMMCLNHSNKTMRNLYKFFFFNAALSSKIILPHETCTYQTVSVKIYNRKKNPPYLLCLIFSTFWLSAHIFTFSSSVISKSTLYTCHYNSIPRS